jgi:hypothetical protein
MQSPWSEISAQTTGGRHDDGSETGTSLEAALAMARAMQRAAADRADLEMLVEAIEYARTGRWLRLNWTYQSCRQRIQDNCVCRGCDGARLVGTKHSSPR